MIDGKNLPHLLAKFRQNPNTEFSQDELSTLQAASMSDIWAAKAVALHYAKLKDFSKVLAPAERVAEAEPTSENLINLAVTFRGLKQYSKCIEFLKRNQSLIDPIRFNDLMCSSYAYLGNTREATLFGDKALHLKDKGAAPVIGNRSLHEFNRERRDKNIISFSVWGREIRYLQGALNNAIVARYLYPSWTARFYTDGSIPADFRDALTKNAAQVVVVTDMPSERYGTTWRFLVEDDEGVDFFIIRDADSVINIKECWAVTDWLKSSTAFHVMRDDLQHSELMLAGMWGAHRGNIQKMRQRLVLFFCDLPNVGNYVHADQHFLRRVVWPIARTSVVAHDRFFSFGEPRRYSPDYELPARMHIGQNDWAHWRKA